MNVATASDKVPSPFWPGLKARTLHIHPAIQFLVLLAAALALRASTFGHPNLHVDEAFYHTVGIAMHDGVIPYVDVWDRKPWGLFFIYYLIAFISPAPLTYQLVATAFAAATAWIIGRFAREWTNSQGALFAGLVYLLWLDRLQGFGGQSPVFYNLFIAVAALLVFRSRVQLREGSVPRQLPLAMLIAGTAITVKQTALFEASFLGIYAACQIMRSPMERNRVALVVAGWMALGAAPFLCISAWYFLGGYWDIYWQAMVQSNLDKPGYLYGATIRAIITFTILGPVLMVATLSLPGWRGESKRFIGFWMLAAIAGLVSVPNFYMHYSLPIMVPLSIATAAFLSKPVVGPIATAGLCLWSFQTSHAFDFDNTRRSIAAMDELATTVREHHGDGPLFVVDGPPQLYVLTNNAFPTPLIFPHHLGHLIEKDVSHLSTLGEARRVLASRPGIVVMPDKPRQSPPNMEVIAEVDRYVHGNCRKVASVETPDLLTSARMNVWSDCRRESLR